MIKKAFLISMIYAATSLAVTHLESRAALVQPGKWGVVSADSLRGDMVTTGPVSDIIYAFSNSACWDTRTKQLLYVGGPHMAPMRFNIYRESTNGWRNIPLDNSWISHSYDNFTLDSAGRMNWMHAGKIRVFDAALDQWVDSFNQPSISSRYGGMEYFPEKNALVYVLSGSVYYCPLSTKVWQTLRSGLSMGNIHNIAEYNPVNKKIYFGGGDGSKALYSLDTNLIVTRETDSPIIYRIAGALMTCDHASGHVLFVDSSGVYAFDPVNNISGRVTNSMVRYPSKAVIAPIPDYGIIAFISVDMYPFLLYRHNPASVLAETNNDVKKSAVSVSPNPFNPATNISVFLTQDAHLRASIYNTQGKMVAVIADKRVSRGSHVIKWDGRGENGTTLSGGVYFVKIEAGENRYLEKVVYAR